MHQPAYLSLCSVRIMVLLSTLGLVSCNSASFPSIVPFSVGGSVTGLQGSLILQNNLTNTLTLTNDGPFVFSNKLPDNSNYSVTLQAMPVGQSCTLANGTGQINGANVNTILVTCQSTNDTAGFSVGGSISGLTGTLVLHNNDANPTAISRNGPYSFSNKLADGELYNISLAQQPLNQVCSINNLSGQVDGINIENVDIFCTAASNTVSLSGSLRSAPLTQIDSDINDPASTANVSNNGALSAQRIPNFSSVQGFATALGTGREGDRFASTADPIDIYRVTLQKNQSIQLQVVDFSGEDVFLGDLDLELYDINQSLVAYSDAIDEFERIVVPADGEYYIQILAYSGTSKYTLSLNGVSPLNISNQRTTNFRAGEAIVQLKPTSVLSRFKAANKTMRLSHEATSRATLARFDVSNRVTRSAQTTDNFIQELAKNNPDSYQKHKTLQQIKRIKLRQDVEFAEPNYIYHAQRVPNDEHYGLQWHYPAINLPQAWDITTGSRAGSDVIVAVIDTGVFLDHPEFSGQLVSGYDFISDRQNALDGDGIDANPDDPGDGAQLNSSSWHGTHVAGTIAARSDNTTGIASVAWGAKIMPLRALGAQGGSAYDVIQAVRYAAGLSNDSNTLPAQKADIINLSLGGPGFSQSSQNTYTAARNAGVLIVAAAGNENTSQLSYPASYDGVISVSATDFANQRAPYSNFGTRIDVAAPGGDKSTDLNGDGNVDGVLSALVDDSTGARTATFDFYQGTSMASPHVAGVLALMRAVHPTLSPNEVDALLAAGSMTTDLGSVGRDDIFGFGLIDTLKAVQAAQQLANGGAAPEQPPLIVANPVQLTLGLTNSAILKLSNVGGQTASITSVASSASWLTATPTSVDANNLGNYLVSVDRSGLNDSSYSGSITFSLSTGRTVQVQVSMLVGSINRSGSIGSIYMLLLDPAGEVVQQALPVDQGNGLFSYNFTDVGVGRYRIVGGSDIDNDILICQLAEMCGGYPTIENIATIETSNVDITGLDFVVDILANFGAAASSVTEENKPGPLGFKRQIINDSAQNQ